MIEARFHPLDLAQWPGVLARSRKSPQFRSTWSQTLDLLEAELLHLDAKEIVIQAGFEARHIRNDGWPRGDAPKPSFPGVIVSFQSNVGALRYATDTYTDGSYWKSTGGSGGGTHYIPGWQANLRAIALTLEALRTVDRHGATSRGEQYVGFGALPAATAMGAALTIEEAATFLGITAPISTLVPLDVDRAYRTVSKAYHPDTPTGDAEKFRRATQAKDLLLDYLG